MNMPEISTIRRAPRAPLFSTRKIVHMSMLIFAFLLPYLTWRQAAGCALLALLFNVVVLPRLGVDLRKSPAGAPGAGVWTGIVIYPHLGAGADPSLPPRPAHCRAPLGPSWRWAMAWRALRQRSARPGATLESRKDLVGFSGIHRGGHGGRIRFDALGSPRRRSRASP